MRLLRESLRWERKLCESDPEVWYTAARASQGARDIDHAKRVCSGCENVLACGEMAQESDERYGVWGGLTINEIREGAELVEPAPLVHVSTFSGIGGIDLAMHNSGVPTVLACESAKASVGVLTDQMPGLSVVPDIRELDRSTLLRYANPDRTVLSSGFPCQGFSTGGKGDGLADPRSGLWHEAARVLDEFRPRWVLLENVPGLLTNKGGKDFGRVVSDLVDIGYGIAWRVLDAQFFGVPQRRRRLYLVGHLGDRGHSAQEVLLDTRTGPRPAGAQRGSGEHAAPGAEEGSGGGVEAGLPQLTFQKVRRSGKRNNRGELPAEKWEARDVAATIAPFDLGSGSRAVELVVRGNSVRRLSPKEVERCFGFPDDWTRTAFGRDQADSPRYAQLGNSVAVPVVEWIGRRMVARHVRNVRTADRKAA